MAKEMMTPGTECNTSARGFNRGDFLVGHVITVDEKWAIPENPCFIQVLNGVSPGGCQLSGIARICFRKAGRLPVPFARNSISSRVSAMCVQTGVPVS